MRKIWVIIKSKEANLRFMKRSQYIKIVNDDTALYLCNLTNEAVIKFPQESRLLIEHILDYPDIDYENIDLENLKQLLYVNGFLISDDFDEIGNLRERYMLAKSGRHTFSIQIATTLQCNFRCPYCYEPHESVFLSKTKQDAIIKFVKSNIYKWKKLRLSWFGGEPLLRPDIIKYLSQNLIKICDQYATDFAGFITTNGYLLNQKNAELLRWCKVKEAQITIDGDKKTHDQRRFLTNGQGTYDTIIRNTFRAKEYLEKFRIRVNVDSQSVSNMIEVMTSLDSIKERTWLAFMPVQKVDGYKNKTLSYKEYLTKVSGLNDLAIKSGFRVSPGHRLPGATYCGAYDENYLLVDARGDVHKCVVMTGQRQYRIGRLNQAGVVIPNLTSRHRWGFDPFTDNECLACDCLPICLGGCQNLPADNKQSFGRCSIKDNLSGNLLSIIQSGRKDYIVGKAAY